MTDRVITGTVNNPERKEVSYLGKTSMAGISKYKEGKARFKYDLLVSFKPEVKNPKKINEIIIDQNEKYGIIEMNPSQYTLGFWTFYLKRIE